MGENVGTAARAMLNFGLTELRLVAPQCGWPNAKAVVAASGAVEVLNRLEMFPDLAAATADLHHTLATTARPREMSKPVQDAEAAAASARAMIGEGRRVGLVFGPERTGLTNDELLLADTLDLLPGQPGLRLAQPRPGRAAVRLCLVPAGFGRDAGGSAGRECRAGDQGRGRRAGRPSGARARPGRASFAPTSGAPA